ncbi:MAG: efflux RND transporter periplasmic adaptor subunit [Hahellaceae bacterium]|nr:efflux RND transporter periplasmic adaptor subunit [Hahellaceae bacterium]MCP5170077.1 efflux RND transporter periplasmic adaptor subunit [Hahellaceae bacterium]
MDQVKQHPGLIRTMLFLLSASVAVWAPSSQAVAETPLLTAPVKVETNALSFFTSGVLMNKGQTRLSFKTSGLINELTFKEGESVKKGQLLARLDLSEIQARQQLAKADLKRAELDVERLKSLVKNQLAPKEQLDNALIRLDKATASLAIENFNLKHSEIVAPENGVVLKQYVEKDEMVTPGQPALLFSGNSEGWIIRAGLIDREAVQVQLGDKVAIQLDAYPGIMLEGKVTELAAQASADTGLFELEIELRHPKVRLLSGLYAHLHIQPSLQPSISRVPASALLKANGRTGQVAQLNPLNHMVEIKTVQIHSLSGDSVLVQQGLNPTWPIVLGSPYHINGLTQNTAASVAAAH